MNDAVPQPARGLFFQHLGVSIHHPVNGAVADGVRADVNAGLMEHPHHLAIDLRIGGRVADVRSVHFRAVLVPRLVHPSGARAAAAVHVDLGAAGKQQAIAQRAGRLGKRGNAAPEPAARIPWCCRRATARRCARPAFSRSAARGRHPTWVGLNPDPSRRSCPRDAIPRCCAGFHGAIARAWEQESDSPSSPSPILSTRRWAGLGRRGRWCRPADRASRP